MSKSKSRNGAIQRLTWYNNYVARMQRGEEQCRECGGTDKLTFDHIHPNSFGGRYSFDNLTILCASCNVARGTAPAGEHVRSLAQEEADAPPERRWSSLPLDPEGPRGRLYAQREGGIAAHLAEDKHGTRSAHEAHGCRCERCRAWNTERRARSSANRGQRGALTHNPFSGLAP